MARQVLRCAGRIINSNEDDFNAFLRDLKITGLSWSIAKGDPVKD